MVVIPKKEKREAALRKLQVPYDQMLKSGRTALQRWEELSVGPNVGQALEKLREAHARIGVASVREAAAAHEVGVLMDWWEIPGEVSAETEELFRKLRNAEA